MTGRGRKAAVESALLRIWYGGQRPPLAVNLGLRVLEWIYKTLRFLTQQDKKSQNSKTHTRPPLLVIGNLIAGGAGKTPVVMAVCQYASKRGIKTGVISRGYGRQAKHAVVISPGEPLPPTSEVGDEPLFLHQQTACPVAVCANRQDAVNALLKAHPGLALIVSDDGLQHHRLARQLEWVVFDERAQGNGRLLPAGPLREPLQRLNSVDAVLCSNVSMSTLRQSLSWPTDKNWYSLTVLLCGFRNLATGQLLSVEEARSNWLSSKVVAFTGLGNPEKLFRALRDAGIELQECMALPDHFNYPDDFCNRFSQQVLITSGKDAVKLNSSNQSIWVAEIQVELPPNLLQTLEDALGSAID